jgi:CMP-N,N'-diacetyllegionaminic acid synthase
MNKKILGIITARGKSQEFPRKNVTSFCGKPLLAWTILASKKSKYISKTIVSSDDDEILKISKSYGAEIIKRPDELAKDNSSSESVIMHSLDYLESKHEFYDEIVLLQPTSPLRTSMDIDNAYELMSKSSANSLISVCKANNRVLKYMKYGVGGYLEGISNNNSISMRRQDLPEVFKPNGAIFIISSISFKKTEKFITNKTVGYEMEAHLSIDIDSENDFRLAEIEMLSLL